MDRHARFRRPGVDRRRRPTDGYRATSAARFERLVDDALASLPAGVSRYLDGVQVSIADVPPPAAPAGRDRVLLGRFESAPPAPARSEPADRLTLFRRPLEARAHERAELFELVRDTVVDELARHFGIDDDRLGELGWP